VSVADFNGDGHPDLLVTLETKGEARELNPLPEAVEILSGEGDGDFTAGPQIQLPEPGWVRVGDFTGNGKKDVVEVPGCEAGGDTLRLNMLLGDGHGKLTPGPTTIDESGGCEYQVGAFTGSGRDDLVTYPPGARAGESGDIEVLPGEPGGGFGPAIETPAPAQGWFLAEDTAELDGDIPPYLVIGRFTEPGTLSVLSANGSGGFLASGPYPAGPHLSFLSAIGDFAADGREDIAVIASQFLTSEADGTISILENNGAGAFSAGPSVPLAGVYSQAFVADVEREKRPDLILSGQSGVSIFLDQPVGISVPGGSSGPQAPTSAARPSIDSARESASTWREGQRLPQALSAMRLKQPPVGTSFTLSLSEQATVTFSFTEARAGRIVDHRCVPAPAGKGGRHRCRRTVTVAKLSFPGRSGANRLRFDGRVSRSQRLAPGRYTLEIVASNSAGRSRARALTFTILK
jgi:hypothetical protein